MHALSCSLQPSGFVGLRGLLWDPCLVRVWTQEAGVSAVEFRWPCSNALRFTEQERESAGLINRKGKVMCLHFGFLFLQRAGILSLLRKGTLQNRRVWQDPFVKLSGVWRAFTSRGSVSLSQEGKFDLRTLSFPPPAPCSSVPVPPSSSPSSSTLPLFPHPPPLPLVFAEHLTGLCRKQGTSNQNTVPEAQAHLSLPTGECIGCVG